MSYKPEQELVSELGGALRELVKHVESVEDWMYTNGYDESQDTEALKYPRAVLSKLDNWLTQQRIPNKLP